MSINSQKVKLNPTESKLITWLNECTDYLKNSPSKHLLFDTKFHQQHGGLEQPKDSLDQQYQTPDRFNDSLQSLELRIAGGWVRDKLLGVETNDLDIGISSLTGQQFARLFSRFIDLKRNQGDEITSEKDMMMGKICTIEARPDQSKHLETATTQFLGLDLDFVQLRSEDYGTQNDSRIPTTVSFGTPLQDALRRDITINSLFYNIHTGLIEDHTEKGLKDLENGLIRTPLPACQTFQDDPLRLLRCIRFATRFNFRLDQGIISAAKSDDIKNALMEKVSRERVGIEVDKMLKGPGALSSLKMIEYLGLYQLVFRAPKGIETNSIDSSIAIRAATWLDCFLKRDRPDSSSINPSICKMIPSVHPELVLPFSYPSYSPLFRRLFLACALLPYRSFTVKSGKKQLCAVDLVIMDSLKYGNHDKTFVSHILQCPEIIDTEKFESILSSKSTHVRLDLGRILRSPHIHDLKMVEDHASLVWQISFLFALVNEFVTLESDVLEASKSTFHDPVIQEKAKKIIDTFGDIVNLTLELDLKFVLTPEFEKSRLDGKEICEVLGVKPGKHIAKIIEQLTNQQIQFPGFSKEDAAIWLKNQRDQSTLTTLWN